MALSTEEAKSLRTKVTVGILWGQALEARGETEAESRGEESVHSEDFLLPAFA